MTAVESSGPALAVARANGRRLGLDVEWLDSDGFGALAGRRFALVAANPPYLSPAELEAAPPELRFEPAEALVAGPTGLEAIARLAAEAPAHLEPGGALLVEVGEGQAEPAAAALRGAGLEGWTPGRPGRGRTRRGRAEAGVTRGPAGLREALVWGGVALLPTDTVYGLAAWLDSRRASRRSTRSRGARATSPARCSSTPAPCWARRWPGSTPPSGTRRQRCCRGREPACCPTPGAATPPPPATRRAPWACARPG